MGKRNRLIPFGIRNIFAGLDGETKQKAEIEYYYAGEDRERELLKLQYEEDSVDYKTSSLYIDLKHKHKTQEEFDYAHAEVISESEEETALRHLDLDLSYKKITDVECDKQKAAILQEPWVHADLRMDPDSGVLTGHFDVDWNTHWIDKLIKNGYTGSSDEEIIQKWLNTINRNSLMEDSGEIIDFEEQKPNQKPLNDGRSEHS